MGEADLSIMNLPLVHILLYGITVVRSLPLGLRGISLHTVPSEFAWIRIYHKASCAAAEPGELRRMQCDDPCFNPF